MSDDQPKFTVKTGTAQGFVQAANIGKVVNIYNTETTPATTHEPAKKSSEIRIQGDKAVKVFISYAREDVEFARKLYHDLRTAGVIPWFDEENLLPDQNWKIMIRKAMGECHFFLTLLSSRALSKRGYVQKELKMALDMLDEFPEEEVFIIPVRLDECQPADERLRYVHYADVFPSYEAGLEKILRALGANERKNGEHR